MLLVFVSRIYDTKDFFWGPEYDVLAFGWTENANPSKAFRTIFFCRVVCKK